MSNLFCHNFKTFYVGDDDETPFDFFCEFDKKNYNTKTVLSTNATTAIFSNDSVQTSFDERTTQSETFLPDHPIAQLKHLPINITSFRVPMVPCSSGHVTRDYLYCDEQSGCVIDEKLDFCQIVSKPSSDNAFGIENTDQNNLFLNDRSIDSNNILETQSSDKVTQTLEVPMFKCTRSGISISYTMVCDYEIQCFDESDENFCVFDECLFNGKFSPPTILCFVFLKWIPFPLNRHKATSYRPVLKSKIKRNFPYTGRHK